MSRSTKRAKCPGCLPEGESSPDALAYFTRSTDDCKPAWRCENCGHCLPRQVKVRRQGRTPSQQRLIDELPKALLNKANEYSRHDHEVKRVDVSDENEFFVSLVVEVGLVGDEDTMASVLCRDYRHIFIRPSGGLELVNAKLKGRSRGWRNVVYGLTS